MLNFIALRLYFWLKVFMRFGHLPYNPISDCYKKLFGHKVFKVPVSLADSCPNRDGIKGMKTCIFCDEHGSFAYPDSQKDTLREQIENHREKVAKRFNSQKFLVYFQAYTTTFHQYKNIEKAFEVAMSYPDVVGIVVGTRPDCLSDRLLELWKHTSEQMFMGVELGVQSFDNHQLEWMRRGHTSEVAQSAILKISNFAPKVNLGIHLMFGWPQETLSDVVRAAHICNALPIHNVKLHNLHVLKNTPLAEFYFNNSFRPIEFEPYAEMVANFLGHLSPETYVHRLIALASNWEELVAPEWTRHKMTNYQKVVDYLNAKNMWQGKLFAAQKSEKVDHATY